MAHPRVMHTNRRDFLGHALALGTGCLFGEGMRLNAATYPTLAQRSPMHVGLVTYNLAKDWDIETIIKNCTEAKFEGVELRTTHKHGVEVSLSKSQRTEIRKRFA